MTCKIATGEIVDKHEADVNNAAVTMGQKSGKTRAEKLTPEKRSEIARDAAQARLVATAADE